MKEMYQPNNSHRRKRLFGIENTLPKKLQKKLKTTMYPLFYESVFCQIDESKFAPLYSEKASRPNCPVNIFVGLEIFKHLFVLSDEQLMENFYFDVRYQVAFGIQEMDEALYSLKSLYNFRRRILLYEEKTGINLIKEVFDELVMGFIEATGTSTQIIRMDSTQLHSKMKALSRIDIMSRTLLRFIRELSQEEQSKYKEYAPYLNKEELSTCLAKIKHEDESLKTIATEIVIILKRYESSDYAQTKAYGLLERVLTDQTIIIDEQLEIKDNKDIAPDSCQSPVDEDATYRKKGGKGYHGYCANISETADKDNETQLITSVSVEPNIYSDIAFLKDELEDLKAKTDMDILIVDGGYTNEATRELAKESNTTLIETGIKGKRPEKTTEDFDIDEEKGIMRCPAGKKPMQTRIRSGKAQGLFSHEDCQDCPYRENCFAKKQMKGMKVDIALSRYARDKQRAYSETKEFYDLKRLRAGVEGAISTLKRKGLNAIQVVGKTRVRMTVTYAAIASNFKRLFKVTTKRRKAIQKAFSPQSVWVNAV